MSKNFNKKHLLQMSTFQYPWERRLYFVALLTDALKKKNIKPIIVGGNAVEFYTLGGYSTGDIDIISIGYEEIDAQLLSWGFKKFGRHWYHRELDIALECPASILEGSYKKVREVIINSLSVFLIGIEDLIIDRLNAYAYHKSRDDGYWAREMLIIHKKQIDWTYLEEEARKESLSKPLSIAKDQRRKL